MRAILLAILHVLRAILNELRNPKPFAAGVRIRFKNQRGEFVMAGNPLVMNVGQSSVATVQVLDQFGNVIPNFDFGANPPSWAVDQSAAVGLSAGSAPNTEGVAGLAATTSGTPANLTVTVPGVVNGSDSEQVTVNSVAPVPTSVKITFSPPA